RRPARSSSAGGAQQPPPLDEVDGQGVHGQPERNRKRQHEDRAVEDLPALPPDAAPSLVQRRALQRIPEDGRANEDVLKNRLQLAGSAGRDDNAATRRIGAEQRDEQLTAEDDDQHPERQLADQRERRVRRVASRQDVERDERRDQQQLVGQRIDELAEVRDPAVLARKVAVPEIREGSDEEDDERGEARGERRDEEQQVDNGCERNARHRDRVRQRAALEQRHISRAT